MLTKALIINAVLLFVVLLSDLGPHREITKFRILRPLVIAGASAPLFIKHPQTRGTGLALEIAAAAGISLGLLTAMLMRVYRSPQTGKPVTRAGVGLCRPMGRGNRRPRCVLLRLSPLVQQLARHLDDPARRHPSGNHRRTRLHGRRHGPHPCDPDRRALPQSARPAPRDRGTKPQPQSDSVWRIAGNTHCMSQARGNPAMTTKAPPP